MCYDRLVEDDVVETRLPDLLRSELRCALRNGALAGVMVLAVLVFEGAPPWLVAASTLGAVVLGAVLHQGLFAVGTLVQRARARSGEADVPSA
ncbi:hypothetical protein ACFQL1_02170 [Halomicroarcula sp. GCM10025709]|uniref:hypothetical protein n=1 Tax=Haloarcula TaxID=2237 RepID=UPI0024C44679|nr:hypothetical protein [Halomicroarcula sp. YJ-61-S]